MSQLLHELGGVGRGLARVAQLARAAGAHGLQGVGGGEGQLLLGGQLWRGQLLGGQLWRGQLLGGQLLGGQLLLGGEGGAGAPVVEQSVDNSAELSTGQSHLSQEVSRLGSIMLDPGAEAGGWKLEATNALLEVDWRPPTPCRRPGRHPAPPSSSAAWLCCLRLSRTESPLTEIISSSRICSCLISSLLSGIKYFRTSVRAKAILACASAGGANAVISTWRSSCRCWYLGSWEARSSSSCHANVEVNDMHLGPIFNYFI